MGRIKRYKWLLIVLTLCVAFGGVAYAGYNVAVIASSPSDQWHACVSNTGVVRVSTMRLNSYPATCPRSTDTVRSWNSSGPSGANGLDGTNGQDGATGPTGPTGPAGDPTTTTSSSSTSSTSSTTTTTAAPTTPYVSANILLNSGPQDVEFDGSNIWVAQSSSKNIAKVDPLTNGVVSTVNFVDSRYTCCGEHANFYQSPRHILFDGLGLWVPAVGDYASLSGISRIDLSNDARTGIDLQGCPESAASDGNFIWVLGNCTDSIQKIDPSTNSIVASINLGSPNYGIVFDGASIWVSNAGAGGRLIKISPLSDSIVSTYNVTYPGTRLAFDGTSVWFQNTLTSIAKIDVATGAISSSVATGTWGVDMVVAGTDLWVASYNGSILRIDTPSLNITTTFNVGGEPRGIAYGAGSIWVTTENVVGHLYRIDNI